MTLTQFEAVLNKNAGFLMFILIVILILSFCLKAC